MIMSGNEAWNRNVFKCWQKVDRDGADITLSGDREGLATDVRQFHGRYQQTIDASRAEGMKIRQIGDTNQLTRVWQCSSVSGLVQILAAREHNKAVLWWLKNWLLMGQRNIFNSREGWARDGTGQFSHLIWPSYKMWASSEGGQCLIMPCNAKILLHLLSKICIRKISNIHIKHKGKRRHTRKLHKIQSHSSRSV